MKRVILDGASKAAEVIGNLIRKGQAIGDAGAVEVGERGSPLPPLTDPDVRISRIRFLGPRIRYMTNSEWTQRGGGNGYRCSSL